MNTLLLVAGWLGSGLVAGWLLDRECQRVYAKSWAARRKEVLTDTACYMLMGPVGLIEMLFATLRRRLR